MVYVDLPEGNDTFYWTSAAFWKTSFDPKVIFWGVQGDWKTQTPDKSCLIQNPDTLW